MGLSFSVQVRGRATARLLSRDQILFNSRLEFGIEPGDLVTGVNDVPVATLSEMYHQVWSLGEAGVKVILNLRRDGENVDVVVQSDSRYRFMERRRHH